MLGLFSAPRALTVKSPSIPVVGGQPALVPLKLEGTEAVNSLFRYTLTLQTPDAMGFTGTGSNFNLDAFIGLEITCSIELEGHGSFVQGMVGGMGVTNQGAGVREISGLITAARFVREDNRHAIYELEIRPWLFLATLSSDCKVFQDMTPVEVIETVLNDYSFASEKRLVETYPKRDYCVQYNETNFEFITRLMQEWGLNFHFEHSGGVHRLIWSDHNGAFQVTQQDVGKGVSAYHEIPYYPLGHKIDREYIHGFSPTNRITSGSYATRDYDYTRPRANLESSASDPRKTGHASKEVYLWRSAKSGLGGSDYNQPNAGADKEANGTEEQGRQLAVLRMQNLRQRGQRAQGVGHVRGIVPGCTFTLSEHPQASANAEYIVLRTDFVIENVNEETQRGQAAGLAANIANGNVLGALSDAQRMSGQWRVQVEFEVQPTTAVLRPEVTQAKPFTRGPQPAVVCGPDPETAEANIYTDYLGRIKIQFPWDRYGKTNNNSSCWVRVSSPWAGNQLGGIHVPRVGQEVVVDFYEGDPDQPIVVGRVHNQRNQPAWQLPAMQALSGFRSRELVPGGGNSSAGRSNHLVLDDTEKKIQAQLKSDHQHSQLSLGHITRIEDNQGRKDYRGEGFELRTDGHGAVRAKDGLFITTYGRAAANEHLLSMAETSEQLTAAYDQHKSMGDLAKHHQAHEDTETSSVQQSLKQQADGVSGIGHTRSADSFPELQAAHLVLSSPAGLESTTPGSTHANSGEHHIVTAGKHISLATAGSMLSSVGKHFRAFANLGVRLFAAKGKVEIQAQDSNIEMLAKKVLSFISTEDWITLSAKQGIRLQVGPTMLVLEPGGSNLVTPGYDHVNAADHQTFGAQSASQQMQALPTSKFNDPYTLRNPLGEPLKNVAVRITRDDGSTITARTDGAGKLPMQKSAMPENIRIEVLHAAS